MDRSQKTELVAHMKQRLSESSLVVVTHQLGLTVGEATELRRQVRAVSAEFKVLKNTLAQIAIQETPLSGLIPMMKGPTALAFSKDSLAAAKAVVQFAKKNDRLKVIGGFFDGEVINAQGVQKLAELPSLDELRSQLLCVINAPATKIALVIKMAMEKWAEEQSHQA